MAETTQSAQQVFDKASKLLTEKNFSEAVDNFEAIGKSGFTSSGTEAGWGRSLVETGEVGGGIRHLMNAVALDRWNDEFRNDLSVAQTKVEAQLGTKMSHPVEWGNLLSSYLRPSEALFMSSLFLLGSIGCVIFSPKHRKRWIALCLSLGVVFAGASFFARYGRSTGILTEKSDLHASPIASSEVVQNLPGGTRLRVIRRSGEFAEVERPGSFRGWVSVANVANTPY